MRSSARSPARGDTLRGVIILVHRVLRVEPRVRAGGLRLRHTGGQGRATRRRRQWRPSLRARALLEQRQNYANFRKHRKAEVRWRTDEILSSLHTMRYCSCEVGSLAPRPTVRRVRYPPFRGVSRRSGDMQLPRRLPHRPLAPPVVAGGCRRVGVARELLHRREVDYGVQEIADEGVFSLTSIVARLTLETR
jgi:hypothetical protein